MTKRKGGRPRGQGQPPKWVETALADLASGQSCVTIGKRYGVDHNTVRYWTDPTFRRRRVEYFRENYYPNNSEDIKARVKGNRKS